MLLLTDLYLFSTNQTGYHIDLKGPYDFSLAHLFLFVGFVDRCLGIVSAQVKPAKSIDLIFLIMQ